MKQKIDVESGLSTTLLYPNMLDSPELRWVFMCKVYSIVAVQLLLTIAFAAAIISAEPISVFFTTTSAGWALFSVLIITPFIVLWTLAYRYKRHPVNYFLLAMFSVATAFAVGLMCAFTSGKIVLEAATLAAGFVVSLTLYIFWAARKGHEFNFIWALLYGAILMSILFTFLQSSFPLAQRLVTFYGFVLQSCSVVMFYMIQTTS